MDVKEASVTEASGLVDDQNGFRAVICARTRSVQSTFKMQR
jgi:hypothetical protein